MPRKIKSSGVSTQGEKTSARRAVGQGPASTRNDNTASDGGKWAGSGRKTVLRHEGPAIARQAQPGRGAKARTTMRSDKRNHPNAG